jgi:subtilisin family serine protease
MAGYYGEVLFLEFSVKVPLYTISMHDELNRSPKGGYFHMQNIRRIAMVMILFLCFSNSLDLWAQSLLTQNTHTIISDSDIIPGQFIVKYSHHQSSSFSDNPLFKKYQIQSMRQIFTNTQNTPLDHIYQYSIPKDTDLSSIIQEFSDLEQVIYAEPIYKSHLLSVPNDEKFTIQWGLHNTGQIIYKDIRGVSGVDINAYDAWDIETGSKDVIIAIIDTGVDYTHPDLSDNIWVNEDEIPNNGIDDDDNGYVDDIHGYDFGDNDSDPLDQWNHGTHCAGIAAAKSNNDIGIAGVCWNCTIMPIKIFHDDGGHSVNDSRGIKYAVDNGADIISMSIHYPGIVNIIKDVIDYAYEKNVVLVAAAGNSGTSKLSYPAGYENVIAVAALNRSNGRCNKNDWDPENTNFLIRGSSYGEGVDVSAPGNYVYSTMPTYPVKGNNNFNTNTGQQWVQNYDFMYGTSMACPHVAGLAALLLSQDADLTNDEIRRIIRANVDFVNSTEYIGTGRINAYKALTRNNTQPETPKKPFGLNFGTNGRKYTFFTFARDEDKDELWYQWDWGDGNRSEWLGPYESGSFCEASYRWYQHANFSVKVKVKDAQGGESYWSNGIMFSTLKNKRIGQFSSCIEWLIDLFNFFYFF